ncbi:MAG: hypothetical protein Q9218_005197 [Villophora microphyllina]
MTRLLLVLTVLLNLLGLYSATALPSSDDKAPDNTLGTYTIDPPPGFSSKIVRSGSSRPLVNRDLYSVTLQALVHYSLEDYEAPAVTYSTRGGPLSPGTVAVHAVARTVPPPQNLNMHMAWALYYSVIAFNNPVNIRETTANIFLYDKLVGHVDYRHALGPMSSAEEPTGNATASAITTSMAQLLQTEDDAVVTKALSPVADEGFSLRWKILPYGGKIRRETAFDTIAYTILCTGPLDKEARLQGERRVAVPGGRVFLKIDPGRTGRWGPMTVGTIAELAQRMAQFLEVGGTFQEALIEYIAPDGSTVGSLGIFYTMDNGVNRSDDRTGNATLSTGSNSTAGQAETA